MDLAELKEVVSRRRISELKSSDLPNEIRQMTAPSSSLHKEIVEITPEIKVSQSHSRKQSMSDTLEAKDVISKSSNLYLNSHKERSVIDMKGIPPPPSKPNHKGRSLIEIKGIPPPPPMPGHRYSGETCILTTEKEMKCGSGSKVAQRCLEGALREGTHKANKNKPGPEPLDAESSSENDEWDD